MYYPDVSDFIGWELYLLVLAHRFARKTVALMIESMKAPLFTGK